MTLQYVVKIKFRAPFHVGPYGGDLNTTSHIVHSWTLYGAIGHAASMLFEASKVREFIKNLKLSSLFPLVEEAGKEIYFVPRPLQMPDNLSPSLMKKLKRLNYVPIHLLKTWKSIREEDITEIHEHLSGIKEINVPSVAIDRSTSASNIYYVSALVHSESLKFYFIAVLSDNKEYENMLKASLRLAAEEGIGGRRHTRGWGIFELSENILTPLEKTPLMEYFEEEKPPWIVISPYVPDDKEIEHISENCYYSIETFRSFVYPTDILKPDIHFFREGSVFNFKPKGKHIVYEDEYGVTPGNVLSLSTLWG